MSRWIVLLTTVLRKFYLDIFDCLLIVIRFVIELVHELVEEGSWNIRKVLYRVMVSSNLGG